MAHHAAADVSVYYVLQPVQVKASRDMMSRARYPWMWVTFMCGCEHHAPRSDQTVCFVESCSLPAEQQSPRAIEGREEVLFGTFEMLTLRKYPSSLGRLCSLPVLRATVLVGAQAVWVESLFRLPRMV